MKKRLQNIYMALIIIFLYAPIVTLMIISFNSSKTRSKWGGFTGKWYVSLFQDEAIMGALYTTLIIALLSALIATIIGTAAALGLNAMHKKARTLFLGVANIPMLNADIVTGVSMMLLFIAFRMNMGFSTILIAHITFNIPYVILSVMPKLKQTKKYTYEAALDLGASPAYAFFKVVFPDIFPGIVSGFLLAFTMSLDDFVITHFTKGPGVDTLSTKIYSEVRKGIRPEMYALSTLMFLFVLFLLVMINISPEDKKTSPKLVASASRFGKLKKAGKMIFTRVVPAILVIVIIAGGFHYRKSAVTDLDNQVIVYNWGEYMDPAVVDLFEEETGIHVVYEEYETNESMYPKIQAGAVNYDVIFPSDYMVQRMIENDLLAEINFDNIPNMKHIDPTYMEFSTQFDPENKYAIPYCWGTVGILYNKSLIHDEIDSWEDLWNPEYRDQILMQNSVRDAFAVALKMLGHSLNSTDLDELTAAKKLLLEQKPLVQAYVIDQVRDKMISGEASIGVIYSGEALFTKKENPDLEYVIPKEGSNIWIDTMVIPKNSQHKENAEAFINFLCRPDIARMNFEYITYSTPNKDVRELLDDPFLKESTIAFPDLDSLENCETFHYLGQENDAIYNELWREVKSK